MDPEAISRRELEAAVIKECEQFLSPRDFIGAIKHVRARLDMGLLESRNFVTPLFERWALAQMVKRDQIELAGPKLLEALEGMLKVYGGLAVTPQILAARAAVREAKGETT